MIRVACFVSALALGTAAFAQSGGATGGAQGTPQSLSLAASLQRGYGNIKLNLTQEADKMPESDYNFKPGSMPEVRTYGQLFGHVANAQFGTCAVVKGVPNPNQGINNEQKATKAEIVKALADSFAFCDDAFSSLTDESAMQKVKQGQNEVTRAAALAGLISHSNEMYGTGAVYLRIKGIVPPSTERMQGRGRGGNQ
jgi:hypothetical protein